MPKVGIQPIRRKQILDAAFKSIAERSLESTRMRHIAKVAGISQPSLHYYFDTKDKLIIALLDRLLAEFKEGRAERLEAATGPLDKLRVLLEQQKRIIIKKSDTLEVYYDFWVQATKRSPVRKKIQQMYANWRADLCQIVDEGVAQGLFRADRASAAPAMLISIFQGAALQSIIDPNDFDLEQYFEQADQFLVSFLGHQEI